MLVYIPRTILPILAITIAAHSVSALRHKPLERKTTTVCAAQCQPMQDAVTAFQTGGLTVLCTQDTVSEYQSCLGCEVSASILTQAGAQAIIDSLAQSCKAGGHPIDDVTVTPIAPTDGTATDTGGAATATDTGTTEDGGVSATGASETGSTPSGSTASAGASSASGIQGGAPVTGASGGSPAQPTAAGRTDKEKVQQQCDLRSVYRVIVDIGPLDRNDYDSSFILFVNHDYTADCSTLDVLGLVSNQETSKPKPWFPETKVMVWSWFWFWFEASETKNHGLNPGFEFLLHFSGNALEDIGQKDLRTVLFGTPGRALARSGLWQCNEPFFSPSRITLTNSVALKLLPRLCTMSVLTSSECHVSDLAEDLPDLDAAFGTRLYTLLNSNEPTLDCDILVIQLTISKTDAWFADERDSRKTRKFGRGARLLVESPSPEQIHTPPNKKDSSRAAGRFFFRHVGNSFRLAAAKGIPKRVVETQLAHAKRLKIRFCGCQTSDFEPQFKIFQALLERSPRWVELSLKLTSHLVLALAGLRDRLPLIRRLWIE
ncbi:hypothetical protein B0H19DRAFT_1238332 [Mycena capillaripes]|nr:hypothetical protein B0H19DRAFT_1238332 [Mycena capillaripes]